jgi:hypothetical protein
VGRRAADAVGGWMVHPYRASPSAPSVAASPHTVSPRPSARLAIRFFVGCALIIPMIIQTILLDPTGAVWTDEPSNVSRPDPSGAVQIDAEHPSRNRKVVGSNPTSGSKTAGQRAFLALLAAWWQQAVIPLGGRRAAGPSTGSPAHRHDPRPSNWCHGQQRRNSIIGGQKGRLGIACCGALRLCGGRCLR